MNVLLKVEMNAKKFLVEIKTEFIKIYINFFWSTISVWPYIFYTKFLIFLFILRMKIKLYYLSLEKLNL